MIEKSIEGLFFCIGLKIRCQEPESTNKYDMVKRSIYYWSQLYSHQPIKGMSYIELNSTTIVNISNFNLFLKIVLFHTTYYLYEDEEKFRMDNMMEFYFTEIPNLLQHWREEYLDPWNDVSSLVIIARHCRSS